MVSSIELVLYSRAIDSGFNSSYIPIIAGGSQVIYIEILSHSESNVVGVAGRHILMFPMLFPVCNQHVSYSSIIR